MLIVDDERDLRTLLDFNLRQAGWRTAQAESGAEALARARALKPTVIVLDLNLPDVSGMDVCRLLRADEETRDAAHPHADRARRRGRSRSGPRARRRRLPAQALQRARAGPARRGRLAPPPLPTASAASTSASRPAASRSIVDAHLCFVDGDELPLTLQEFRLLAYLIQGRGRVRTREELLADVWNASPELETRTVDTHVKRLRDKLGAAGDIIETVRGLGYRIREE